ASPCAPSPVTACGSASASPRPTTWPSTSPPPGSDGRRPRPPTSPGLGPRVSLPAAPTSLARGPEWPCAAVAVLRRPRYGCPWTWVAPCCCDRVEATQAWPPADLGGLVLLWSC